MLKKNWIHILFVLAIAFSVVSPVYAHGNNPHPQKETFNRWPSFGEDSTWRYLIVNGNGGSVSVNDELPFDNSNAEITRKKDLRLFQEYDTDFDLEYPEQYNNIALIGFQGYEPAAKKDIVWNFEMKIDPSVYGTTGFFIEPADTFGPDGSILKPFDYFGVSYAGSQSLNAGLSCSDVVDFALVSQEPIYGVDPFQWNKYEIRYHLVDASTVQATISINGEEVCQSTRANYGETEIQIWLDNNMVTFDPESPYGYSLVYGNELDPQSALFDNISVKAKPARR